MLGGHRSTDCWETLYHGTTHPARCGGLYAVGGRNAGVGAAARALETRAGLDTASQTHSTHCCARSALELRFGRSSTRTGRPLAGADLLAGSAHKTGPGRCWGTICHSFFTEQGNQRLGMGQPNCWHSSPSSRTPFGHPVRRTGPLSELYLHGVPLGTRRAADGPFAGNVVIKGGALFQRPVRPPPGCGQTSTGHSVAITAFTGGRIAVAGRRPR